MMTSRPQEPWAYLATVAGAAASFVLSTFLMDQASDAITLGVPLVVAAAFALTTSWRPLADMLVGRPRGPVLSAAIGGVVALWAAPAVALAQRATDAPSGTETLFFATACWGFLAAISGLVTRRREMWTGTASAALLLAGCAGLLANWERPSSFSPFAKFPAEELLMLVAGAVFVAGAYAIARAARTMGVKKALAVALTAAALVGAVYALPGILDSFGTALLVAPQLLFLGAAVFAFSWGWVRLSTRTGVDRAGSALLLVPAVLTGLWVVERATGAYGADPIVWRGAFAGIAVCIAGATALMLAPHGDTPLGADPSSNVWSWALWAAVSACAAGVVSLWLPAIDAASEGTFGEPFHAVWTMIGVESAAGWVATSAGVLCLAAVVDARHGASARAVFSAALAVLVAACAYPFLLDTTLHTWNGWIPPEVQTSYGTEYARFTVTGILEPVRTAGVVVAAAVAVALVIRAIRDFRRADAEQTEEGR